MANRDTRLESGVVGTLEKVYETEDLIVSFDDVNMTFPGRTNLKGNAPWAHHDREAKLPGLAACKDW